MTKTNKNSWNKQSKRYFDEANYSLDDVVYYDNCFPTEKDLNIFPDVKGKKVLELGSGFCNCGIALAKRGADVTCLDISEQQIKKGEELAKQERVEIKTVVGDYHDLEKFADESYDLVMSIAALPYAKDKKFIFREVNRILKKGGEFVFSTDHPATLPSIHDLPYNYFGEIKWKWNKEDEFEFVTYRCTIADYVNWLVEAGLAIERMEELLPKKIPTDWVDAEVEFRKKYPTCLVMKVRK